MNENTGGEKDKSVQQSARRFGNTYGGKQEIRYLFHIQQQNQLQVEKSLT